MRLSRFVLLGHELASLWLSLLARFSLLLKLSSKEGPRRLVKQQEGGGQGGRDDDFLDESSLVLVEARE